jgi:hypothetical protein
VSGPTLPDPCKCSRPGAYEDDDGLPRCLNCGRVTTPVARPAWAHRSTAN